MGESAKAMAERALRALAKEDLLFSHHHVINARPGAYERLAGFFNDYVKRTVRMHECPVHSFAKHGKEAEELRDGIDDIIGDLESNEDDMVSVSDVAGLLRKLLEQVDSRDSLAYLESARRASSPSGPPDSTG